MIKVKGKGILFNVGGQTGTDCLLTWADGVKLPIVGIEPATFRSKSAAHTTYTMGPHIIHMKLIFLSELFSLQPSVMITFLYKFVRKMLNTSCLFLEKILGSVMPESFLTDVSFFHWTWFFLKSFRSESTPVGFANFFCMAVWIETHPTLSMFLCFITTVLQVSTGKFTRSQVLPYAPTRIVHSP